MFQAGDENVPGWPITGQFVWDQSDLNSAAEVVIQLGLVHQRHVGARLNADDRLGGRKRRSTEPVNELLTARLELTDADPSSSFVITKIEFKETYADKVETHCVDFETKSFLQDTQKSGSKLVAEFEMGGKVFPANDEPNRVVTYNIVLRPRVN